MSGTCRVESVLLDQQPSLLTLRRRAFRLCSNDSSVLCRCPTPRRRARGPYGLSLLPAVLRLRFTAGISEVSRFSCMKFLGVPGPSTTPDQQGLALSPLSVLPSAHVNRVGVWVVSLRSSISHPAYYVGRECSMNSLGHLWLFRLISTAHSRLPSVSPLASPAKMMPSTRHKSETRGSLLCRSSPKRRSVPADGQLVASCQSSS